MKYKSYNLEIREGAEMTNTSTYMCGIFWILQLMFRDLIEQLSEEGRCFGIVKSYIDSVQTAYGKTELKDEDIYRRILYIFKPILLKEHKRLTVKHLSPADSNICIMKKLATILGEDSDFIYVKEVGTLIKILTRLHDNIRNRAKKDNLFALAASIREYIKSGVLGKHEIHNFTLLGNEDEVMKELKLEKEKIIFERGLENKILEINIMDYGKKDDKHSNSE